MRSAPPLLPFCILHFAFCISCSSPPPAVTPTRPIDSLQQLRDDITAATRSAGVQRAAWGIVVESLERNERLVELNPGTLLVPASAVKLVSLAAAVDAVGWDYSFVTRLRARRPYNNGVLEGDLIVQGTGDPTIGTRNGANMEDLASVIKSDGVRRIEGRIIGDDNAVEEPRPQLAWAWDDLGYPSGAIFGALNFAENRMDVFVRPGANAGDPAVLDVDPAASERPLRNRAVTGAPASALLLWPEQRPGETFLTIAGSIPAGASPARLSVSAGNPTLWFAIALRRALVDAGITVTGDAYDVDDVANSVDWESTEAVASSNSIRLAELARPLLKDSINLYGEAVLRLNAPKGTFPTNDAALEGLRRTMVGWGIPDNAWQIVDGSGLSRRNAVAPEVLVAVLQRMYDATGESPWMTALPVAGRDGTLAERMRGTAAEANVRAKTGTMSNIRTLAGYVRTQDGETLAFAIMADNFEGSGAAAVGAIDRIAVRLAEFSRRPH